MLKKFVFLYNIIIIDDDELSMAFAKDGTLDDLMYVLNKFTKDGEGEDMAEKALRIIHTIITGSNTPAFDVLKQSVRQAKQKYSAEIFSFNWFWMEMEVYTFRENILPERYNQIRLPYYKEYTRLLIVTSAAVLQEISWRKDACSRHIYPLAAFTFVSEENKENGRTLRLFST